MEITVTTLINLVDFQVLPAYRGEIGRNWLYVVWVVLHLKKNTWIDTALLVVLREHSLHEKNYLTITKYWTKNYANLQEGTFYNPQQNYMISKSLVFNFALKTKRYN